MKRRGGRSWALVAACALVLPAAASGQDSDIEERRVQIATQLQDMANLLGREAMFPALERFEGRLAEGASHRLTLSLGADREWQIVGVCDRACSNVDLVLRSQDGEELADDRLPDEIPLLAVATRAPGSFELEVVMTDCAEDFCFWGVRAFSKRSGDLSDAPTRRSPTPLP